LVVNVILKTRRRVILLIVVLLGLAGLLTAGYFAWQGNYTIYDGDDVTLVSGRFQTVAEVLAAANVAVRPEDAVEPALDDTAVPATAIVIQRAQPITVHTANGQQTYWSLAPTLGAFLAETGLTIG